MGLLRNILRKLKLPGGEKRVAERFSFNEPVDIAFWLAPKYRFEYGQLENLSVRGVRFVSFYKLPRGIRFELEIHLPDAYAKGRTVRMMAKSVYCFKWPGQKRYRVGCEFQNPDPGRLGEIDKFLSWAKAGKAPGIPQGECPPSGA